jgi:hypothetical protein
MNGPVPATKRTQLGSGSGYLAVSSTSASGVRALRDHCPRYKTAFGEHLFCPRDGELASDSFVIGERYRIEELFGAGGMAFSPRERPMSTVRWFVVIATWCAAIGIAKAWTDTAAEARAHFTAGQELVAHRQFDDAYREFESGYALSGRALFLFNMAECARESGRTSQARIDYARYLAADPDGSQAEVARERLAILDPEPSTPARSEPAQMATPEEPAASTTAVPESDFVSRCHADGRRASRGSGDLGRLGFWTIIGNVPLAGAIAGTVVGVTMSEQPSCGMGCMDWRM